MTATTKPAGTPTDTTTGRCQCGAVRYEFAGAPVALYACHCLECRKQSASAFGMSLEIPRAGFRVTQGSPRFWVRAADSGGTVRCAFCANCGSRLWHESTADSARLTVKAGSLDQPVDFSAAIHIWTKRKLPGFAIPDGARQYPEEPPE
jgi:hypothetical protein